MVGIRVFSNAVITTDVKTPLNIRMRAFSFFLSFKLTFFPLYWTWSTSCLVGFMSFFFQPPWHQGAMCHLRVPLQTVSQRLSWERVDPGLTYNFSLRRCVHRVSVVTPRVCAVHFIGSQGSLFCPPAHVSCWSSAACMALTCIYRFPPSYRPEKLTTMNFTEVYDWFPTGPEFSSGCILAVR